jgi:hypothetical protein
MQQLPHGQGFRVLAVIRSLPTLSNTTGAFPAWYSGTACCMPQEVSRKQSATVLLQFQVAVTTEMK